MRTDNTKLLRLRKMIWAMTSVLIIITIAVWVYVGILEKQHNELRQEVEDLYLELEELENLPDRSA